MFCTKSGKQIEDGATLCAECLENQPQDQYTQPIEDVETETTVENTEDVTEEVADEPGYTVVDLPEEYEDETAPEMPMGSRKTGLGKAIAAVILSSISYFLASIAMGVISVSTDEDLVLICLALAVIASIPTIPAFVFSIISINTFRRCKRLGEITPIPTLIIGIVSLITVISTWFVDLLNLSLAALLLG